MKPETLAFVKSYGENTTPSDATEILTYLCSMLWLCRTDKLRQEDIPLLADISNAAFQASEEFQAIPVLSENPKDYRMSENVIHFQNVSHGDLKRAVKRHLLDILEPPKPKKKGILGFFARG